MYVPRLLRAALSGVHAEASRLIDGACDKETQEQIVTETNWTAQEVLAISEKLIATDEKHQRPEAALPILS
jgi:hypothetical protein